MNYGQLFIVGFEGTTLSKEVKEKLLKIQPAGIILYDTNIETKEQVRKLISDLKSLLGDDLIITVDQEGGKVERLRRVNSSLPSLWASGRAAKLKGELNDQKFDKDLLLSHTELLATEMMDLGFNMVFGPCVDLNTNPHNPIIGPRSFCFKSDLVSELTELVIAKYKELGLKTSAKHFPGHGATELDSHIDLPILKFDDCKREFAEHLEPFKAAIKAGADSIMVSHVAFPQLEEEHGEAAKIPATFSKILIQKELRKKLGYKGVVISDELTMGAVSRFGSPGEVSQKCLEAGCDLLVWFTDLDDPLSAIEYLDDNYENDIDDSLARIAEFKKPAKQKIDLKDRSAQMKEIVSIAANLHREVKLNDYEILVFDHPKLELELIESVFNKKPILVSQDKAPSEQAEALKVKAKQILFLAFQAHNYPVQKELIKMLRENYDVIHVSTDMPDDGADVDLWGTNRVHLETLKSLL